VSGPYLARLLSSELGASVAANDPYSLQSTGCTSGRPAVFLHGTIPTTAWSTPAQKLLQYIPVPNSANGFATSAFNQSVDDDKEALRLDANTHPGLLSAYYFNDGFTLDNPYPVAQRLSGYQSRLLLRAANFMAKSTPEAPQEPD